MSKLIKNISIYWGLLFMITALCQPLMAVKAEQDTITHKVSVDVMLIPIFVVGTDGNPVFDLKKDDFEVYANGVPVKIAQFIQFDFEHQEEVLEEVAVTKEKVRGKQPSRAVFLIIDSVFNSVPGYRRAKKIAIDIIQNGSPEDMFIVLENRAGGGPRHIAGPDESKEAIIKEINKLKLPSGKWDRDLHLTREWNILADSQYYDAVHDAASLEDLTKRLRYTDQLAYKNQAHHFSRFLSQFKYALKTITRPKVVFLISEGIAKAAFKDLKAPEEVPEYGKFQSAFRKTEKRVSEENEAREMRLFEDLQKIVKAMNEGGSVLYTINPGKFRHDEEASGEMSLKYLAHESGGQYIAGSDAEKIVKKVKKTTAAYYELAFAATPDLGKNIDLQIKCKREGVEINTFKQTERTKPYLRMDPVGKKLFALNMVTGGSWSRMMGKVVRIKYRMLRNEKSGDETYVMVEVPLPEKMKDRKLDMFLVQLEPKTKKVNIEMLTQAVKDRANFIIRKKDNTTEFFVIIEPIFAYCIYNQV